MVDPDGTQSSSRRAPKQSSAGLPSTASLVAKAVVPSGRSLIVKGIVSEWHFRADSVLLLVQAAGSTSHASLLA